MGEGLSEAVPPTVSQAPILVTLGLLLLLGLATDALGHRTRLPRVTLLLLLGIAIGPEVLDLLPQERERWFPLITNLALAMVGFLLGEKLDARTLREHGRSVLGISAAVVLVTVVLVTGGLWLIGVDAQLALLLGGIATATAPAATSDVVAEAGAEGPFARTLLGIVAVDDAWGLIVFSLLLAAAGVVNGDGSAENALAHAGRDLGGAVLVGIALGLPAAALSGRLEPGEPTLLEALGMVLLCGGVALYLEVSFLLSAMVLGSVVSNTARHHTRPFHAIQGIERPFLIVFFLLSGASLDLSALPALGLAGGGYVVLRVGGRLLGARLGARLAGEPPEVGRSMGPALLPQAGVALGMALLGAERLPDLAGTLLPLVVASTVIFELTGPIFTRRALERMGEAG